MRNGVRVYLDYVTGLVLLLGSNLVCADDARNGVYIQNHFMASRYESHDESAASGHDNASQAYIRLANFLSPGTSVWIGRRHYGDKSIYLNDRYWTNVGRGADTGLGIEGLTFGPGKLSVAMFRVVNASIQSLGGLRHNTQTLNSTNLDIRFAGLSTNTGGTLSLWGQGVRRAARESPDFKEKFGYGAGAWHDQKGVLGGSNMFAVTYRNGVAVMQGMFNPNPAREDQGYDLDEASAWEVNNNLLVKPTDKLSMQWGAIARVLDFGRKGRAGNILRWFSTGVKPVYSFTDRVSLATEFGVDYVDDEYRDLKGSVRKYTVALQLSDGRGDYTQPAVRLFLTKAMWSEEFKGLVGAAPGDTLYGGATEGWTVGVQLKASW